MPNNVFIEVLSLIYQLLTISMTFPFWKMKLYLAHIQYPLTPLPTLPIDWVVFCWWAHAGAHAQSPGVAYN